MPSAVTQPNYADAAQSGSAYPTAIDAITQVMARIATAFNPHAVPAAAAAPVLSSSAGGALGARTYYAKITLVTPAGEVAPSAASNLALNANTLLNVASPTFALGVTGWNVYVGTSSGNETKQNSSPVALGTAWVEPTGGLISGAALPAGMSQMKVIVDAGVIPATGALATEVAAQLTSAITAPATNPRKDIVYIDATGGAVGIATGTEAASPADPAVLAGKVAVARINCTVGMTAIANALLDDLRSPLNAATNAWTTGDVKLTLKNTADTGWVLMNDGTIGSASSVASARAAADCEALFKLLWNNFSDTWCPVVSGRGASAQADWDANKKITLPRALGRTLAISGAGSGLTSRALGEYLGAETHILTTGEMPAHTHGGVFVNAAGYTDGNTPNVQFNLGSTAGAGGGQAHNNMQPSAFFNVMVKL